MATGHSYLTASAAPEVGWSSLSHWLSPGTNHTTTKWKTTITLSLTVAVGQYLWEGLVRKFCLRVQSHGTSSGAALHMAAGS